MQLSWLVHVCLAWHADVFFYFVEVCVILFKMWHLRVCIVPIHQSLINLNMKMRTYSLLFYVHTPVL